MSKISILFDLDMTLLDTSRLYQYRFQQNWGYVKNNLNLVVPFSGHKVAPHQLPGLLKQKGYRVAIVTSSPKWYAKSLLDRFSISHDVLVAYEDTELHKPDPAPILFALEQIERLPAYAHYLGDQIVDMQASFRSGVIPIGAMWGMSSLKEIAGNAPDILVNNPHLLLDPNEYPKLGYLLEAAFSDLGEYYIHDGNVLTWDEYGYKTYALGRYFPEKDGRHFKSELSKRIMEINSRPVMSHVFASSIATLVETFLAMDNWVPTIVTCVPPKPGQTNRFLSIFEELLNMVSGKIRIIPDGLVTSANPDQIAGNVVKLKAC
jgi:HAD superfamily hydrolase (TIGR01549 family)